MAVVENVAMGEIPLLTNALVRMVRKVKEAVAEAVVEVAVEGVEENFDHVE